MKQLLLLSLVLFQVNAQNINKEGNGYFDIGKEEFYYEKMDEWKSNIHKSGSWFEIITDNKNTFKFKAENLYFRETYQLSLNESARITKIEYFIVPKYKRLSDFFPYKYPIKISDIFKNLGSPDETKENISFKDKLTEYNYKKYYKWDNVLYQNTNRVKLKVAYGTVKIPKIKRGRIKSYKISEIGYLSYTAQGNGKVTEDEMKWQTASEISKGARKIWNNNKNELINLLGLEVYEKNSTLINSPKIHPTYFLIDNSNDPDEYYINFVSYGTIFFNLGYDIFVADDNKKYTYTSLPDGTLATAVGMNKKCCIEILIDLNNWNKSTYLDKLFIMYHELGHDMFELKHTDGIRLMATNKIDIENPSVFGEMIAEMFIAILKKQKP